MRLLWEIMLNTITSKSLIETKSLEMQNIYEWGFQVMISLTNGHHKQYSKICVKQRLKNRQNKDLIDKW